MHKNPKSKCCNAPMKVGGDDKEGTHYFICAACLHPTDIREDKELVDMPKNKPEKSCPCACHINTLKKPYAHDVKCCNEMNGYYVEPEESEPMSAKYDMCFCPEKCRVHPPQPESWSERFEKKFCVPYAKEYLMNTSAEEVKSFIQTEIEKARKEATEAEFNRWIDTVKDRIDKASYERGRKEAIEETMRECAKLAEGLEKLNKYDIF